MKRKFTVKIIAHTVRVIGASHVADRVLVFLFLNIIPILLRAEPRMHVRTMMSRSRSVVVFIYVGGIRPKARERKNWT